MSDSQSPDCDTFCFDSFKGEAVMYVHKKIDQLQFKLWTSTFPLIL